MVVTHIKYNNEKKNMIFCNIKYNNKNIIIVLYYLPRSQEGQKETRSSALLIDQASKENETSSELYVGEKGERKITANVNSLSEKPQPICGTITPDYVVIVIMERARTVVC